VKTHRHRRKSTASRWRFISRVALVAWSQQSITFRSDLGGKAMPGIQRACPFIAHLALLFLLALAGNCLSAAISPRHARARSQACAGCVKRTGNTPEAIGF